ncbi:nuclear transport factor 2 family protein [Polyangium sp. 15x6]|uniref:nuclear transport factor 2 family protein n=1 Tax=Polyangium sp. 15x6 TaxID=3042687 RepID=UPI00249B17C8|nr:nuclear transport factor 2 family protein [Polyangium sp. 15x6]MDI3285621.1 nuclear transport factor 2 family protein [Polyangium sp. 15x6]
MNAVSVVDAYFSAWRANDPDRLEQLLAKDVSVKGPLGRIEGAKAYRQALAWLFGITRDLVIVKQWVDGPDVLNWFDLHHTNGAEPMPAVNWLRVEEGLITRVSVAFDPRPILPAGAQTAKDSDHP